MKKHENNAAQQSFIVMCRILKKYDGIYYSRIAADMQVDTALFCRWMNESVKLSPHYNEKIESYFRKVFKEAYREMLVEQLIVRLEIQADGRLAFMLRHMRYTELLHYLFHQLRISDIEKEREYHALFPDVVYEAIERKTEITFSGQFTLDINHFLFDTCSTEIFHQLESGKITPQNTMIMDISRCKERQRILVHFCSEAEDGAVSYAEKCCLLTKLKAFGRIDRIFFVHTPQMPPETGAFEKMSDYAARKIIKLIRNSIKS